MPERSLASLKDVMSGYPPDVMTDELDALSLVPLSVLDWQKTYDELVAHQSNTTEAPEAE